MKVNYPNTSIDLALYLSSSLLCGTQLQRFQRNLVQLAPEWASGLHLQRFGEARVPIDATRDGAIEDLVLSRGIGRGELYQHLQKVASSRLPDRRFGSIELCGANRELTIVLSFDDWVFCPLGQAWIPGNRIAIQVRRSVVEGKSAPSWVEDSFAHCCANLDPLFGFACDTEEYHSKNMSTEGGGLRAIGIDISQYLPGLYWLNFFGSPYRRLMGEERLASAPGFRVGVCGSGHIVNLSDDPKHWTLPEYTACEESVRRHLGEEYFFIRNRQERKTVSPFDLQNLPAPALTVEADVDLDSAIKQIRINEHRDRQRSQEKQGPEKPKESRSRKIL